MGQFLHTIAKKGTAAGQVTTPRGIALGPAEKVYVVDSGNKRVQVFDKNGTYLRSIGDAVIFTSPWGVAVDGAGQVFVSDSSQHRIHVFDAAGNLTNSWGEPGGLDHQLKQPKGLAIGPDGDVYVADSFHYAVKRFTPTGDLKLKLYLPSLGGGGTSTHAHYGPKPRTVAVRQDGVILTASPSAHSFSTGYFWMFTPLGDLIQKLSYADGNSANASSPSALAVRKNGSFTVYTSFVTNNFLNYQSSFRAGPVGQPDGIPFPTVLGVDQPFGSTHLNVSYKVTDADSAKVTTALLGFRGGGNGIGSVIVPKTFVGGVAGKLGEDVDVNATKSVTWDIANDWNGTVGSLAVEVLAKDDRDLIDIHFVEIPGDENNATALTINRFPITDEDFLSAWYWLIATGDTGIKLEEGAVWAHDADVNATVSPAGMTGKLLWLDASDVDGDGQPDSLGDGSKVAFWKDKSGNDLNASQSDVDRQPTYLADGGNGKPTLSFTNDYLTAANVDFNAKQILVVTRHRSPISHIKALISRGGDYGQLRSLNNNNYDNSSRAFNSSDGEFRVNSQTTRALPLDVYHVVSAKLGTGATHAGHFQDFHIGEDVGNTGYWPGEVCEVLVFDRFLSETEQLQVEWYFGWKWGLDGPIPAGDKAYAAHTSTIPAGRSYLLAKMNLREATAAEVTRALEATTPGTVNQFDPDFRIQPIGNPEKVNEFGIESARTGTWVVPNN